MARPTTSFALNEHYRNFAERKVREGRYSSNSDVIRAAMRLLELEEAKLDQLKAAIQEGIDGGPAEPFDVDQFLGDLKRQR